VGEKKHEFITAQSGGRIHRTNLILQRAPDKAQGRIARRMAVCVVDGFKIVEIDQHQQAALDQPAAATIQFAREGIVKATAVQKAGQFVGGCDFFQFANALFLMEDAVFGFLDHVMRLFQQRQCCTHAAFPSVLFACMLLQHVEKRCRNIRFEFQFEILRPFCLLDFLPFVRLSARADVIPVRVDATGVRGASTLTSL
jgi:hypothetical protein